MKRVLLIILFIALFVCDAQGAGGSTVSLSLKDRPLFELFEILKSRGGLTIVYSREQLCREGVAVTINIELDHVKALLVLEVASKAAGFTFEKKGSIYIIHPIRDRVNSEETASSLPDKVHTPVQQEKERPEQKKNIQEEKKTSEPEPEKKNEQPLPAPEIDMNNDNTLHKDRYTGNFMYGHGGKIYLNLIIPEVDTKEKERVLSAMVKAIRDRKFTADEAASLFGEGSQLKGREISLFVKALYKQVLIALQDGNLTDMEIHKLRNGFINAVRNRYEGM